MKTALLELAVTFPAELLKRTKAAAKKSEADDDERTEVERRERYIKINYREHCPKTPLLETLALYAQADFVIGPHGAGYEQNMMTTARLGSAYHGSDGFNYVVNVPHLVGLVTSVLESRFLGNSPANATPAVKPAPTHQR
ncbi:uncharacterized protein ACA1_357470 [Acanthamoeba castellanii str. Neff]|uniref:Uncharacterized protein n=1 Tax=Acanthamoeba castellanii (strain ATCC 30010 / Neff) TaxID=1257118 RepID=L8HFH7_ACACF|nr:uncharacterized protein ACA1_357470 [Acanthamoeba castellanii str. Neff]ELR23166.1 hypothetical protein ACA1_357470 [Acanthamoeba castellanii str. Neff]